MEIGIIPYLQRSLRINDYTCLYMFILNDSINNGYMNPHQSHYGYTTSMYVCMYVYIYIMYIYNYLYIISIPRIHKDNIYIYNKSQVIP